MNLAQAIPFTLAAAYLAAVVAQSGKVIVGRASAQEVATTPLPKNETQILFDELLTKGTSGPRRVELVERLSSKPFSEAGVLAAQAQCLKGGRIGWGFDCLLVEEASDEDKIIWAGLTIFEKVVQRGDNDVVAAELVRLAAESSRPACERELYLHALHRKYHSSAKPGLMKLANAPSLDPELAFIASSVLLNKEKIDEFADLFIRNCQRTEPASYHSMYFCDGVPYSAKLSASRETKRKLVKYGFGLLPADGGKEEEGYFLASELAQILGLEDTSRNRLFGYDLSEYPHKTGALDDPCFQGPSIVAKKWWATHRHEYADPVDATR